jgi:hypothetical protein
MRSQFSSAVIASVIVAMSSVVGVANAGIISDYSKFVADDSWNIVYQGAYGTDFDYASILGSIVPGSTVALASSSSAGSLTYDLFASTSATTLSTITASNTTIFDNDVFWYRNSSSLGFADTSTISQSSADTHCRDDEVCGDLRLSWHTNNDKGNIVTGGWRSGVNTGLNDDDVWQRYVLVLDQNSESVPEPSTLAIFALSLIGLASRRFKK